MWPFSLLPIPPLPPLPPERMWYPNICKDQLNPYNPSISTFWYLPRNGMPLESAPAPVQGMAARLVMWLSAVLPASSQTQSTLERVVAWLVPATVPRGASTYELNACMHVFKPAGPIYTHPNVLWIVRIVLTVLALYYTVLLVFKLHSVRVAFIAQSDATGGHTANDQDTWLQRFTSLGRAARNTFRARPVLAQNDQDTWLQRFTSVGRAVRNTLRLPARQDTNDNPDWRDWFKLDTAQRLRERGWRVPTVRVPSLIQRVDVAKMRDFRSWFKRPVPSPLEVPLPVSRPSSPFQDDLPSLLKDDSPAPPSATAVPVSLAPSPSPAPPRQALHSPTPHHSRASLADLLAAWDESSHAQSQTQTLPLSRPRSVSPSIQRSVSPSRPRSVSPSIARSLSPSISRSLSPLAPLEGRRALRPKPKTRRRRSGSLDSPRRDHHDEVKSWSEPVTDAEMDDARRCKALDLAKLRIVDVNQVVDEPHVDVAPAPVLETETTISLAPADSDTVQDLNTFDAQPTLLEGTTVLGVEASDAPPSAPIAFEDTTPGPTTELELAIDTTPVRRGCASTLLEGTIVLGVEAHGAPPSAPTAFEDATPESATATEPETAPVAHTDAITVPLTVNTAEVAPVTNDAQTEVLTASEPVEPPTDVTSSPSSDSSALEPVTPTSPVPAPVLVAIAPSSPVSTSSVDNLPSTEPSVAAAAAAAAAAVPTPVIENNPYADRRTFWTLDDGTTPSSTSSSPRGRKSKPTGSKLPAPAPAPVENNPHVDVKTFYSDDDAGPSPGKKRRQRKKKTRATSPANGSERDLVQKQDVAQDRPVSPRAPPAKVSLEQHVAQDRPTPAPVTPSRIPQRQTPLRIPQPQVETPPAQSPPPKTPRIILPPGFTQALRGVIPPANRADLPPPRVPFNQNYPTPGAGPSTPPWKPKPHFARSGPRASDRANQQHHLEAFGAPVQYAVPSPVLGRENVIVESPAPAPTPAPAPVPAPTSPSPPDSESEEEEEDAPRRKGRRRFGAAWRLRMHGYGTADIDWLFLNWPTEYSKPSHPPDSLLPP